MVKYYIHIYIKDALETVQYITAGYKMLAGKAYLERHNLVVAIVYGNICASILVLVGALRAVTPLSWESGSNKSQE